MVKNSLLLVFIFMSASCYTYGQKTEINLNANSGIILINGIKYIADTTVDLQKSIAFIKEVQGQDLSTDQLILGNDPKIFSPLNCFEQILKDDYYLRKDEWLYMRNKFIPQLTNWSLYYIQPSSINAKEKKQVSNKSIAWPYFYKEITSKGISENKFFFSVPIFIRNKENSKYCIFYFRNECGPECGMADLSLYINNNGHWVKIKSYCGWIS